VKVRAARPPRRPLVQVVTAAGLWRTAGASLALYGAAMIAYAIGAAAWVLVPLGLVTMLAGLGAVRRGRPS